MKIKYNDKWHSYYFTDDEGKNKRCKSVTTLAKIPDNTFNLEKWAKRMVAYGVTITPSLVESIAAHHDDKKAMDDLCEEAMKAAKAHERAAIGTAMHRITERIDFGETLIDTPLSRAVQEAWGRALRSANLEIMPEYIERMVVYPDLWIAGRFDRFVKNKSTHKIHCLDLKSGERAVEYPHSIACQMALYVNAPWMAAPIPGSGGETETFEAMPKRLDKKVGYIVHMSPEGDVAVHEVDIEAGWDVVKNVIFPTLAWRDRKDLTKLVAEQAIQLGPASEERLAWIRGRLAVFGMCEQPVKEAVAARWPVGVTPKADWTDSEVDTLSQVFDSVERDYGTVFSNPDTLIVAGKAS